MPTHQPQKIPFTPEAYQKLKHDIERLAQKRLETMERVKIAREMGDLSENAAYKYGRIEVGDISRQLRHLKHLLSSAQVITKTQASHKVEFGAVVTLENSSGQVTYTIVSQHESDPKQGKISMSSPLGQALLNKKIGEQVIVQAPRGEIQYTIIDIK